MNAVLDSLENLVGALIEESGDQQLVNDFKLYINCAFHEPQDLERTHPLHPLCAFAQPDDQRGNRNRLWVKLTDTAPVYYEPLIELMFDRPDSDSYMYTTRLLRSWLRYGARQYQ
jgi:hypothetical protein